MNKDKLLLYKLDLGDLGIIYAPITEDVLQMEEDKFNKLLTPFIIDFDTFGIKKEDAEKEGLKRLDIFTSSKDKDLCNSLIDSLKYFYKTETIMLVYDIISVTCKDIEKTIYINRDNFDELCEIILKLCNVEKSKEEKKREINVQVETDEGKLALEKLRKMREQSQDKNNKHMTLKQIINIVVHGGNKNYKEVFEMTYYQLINSYTCIIQIDSYRTFMAYKTSGQFEIKEEIPHWTETIE